MPDPLASLRRSDKWYLGGGNRLVWTPAFPAWLDHPGFWDEAHYYNLPIQPVFAVAVLDEQGQAIALRAEGRRWQPDRIRQTYTTGAGLVLIERKVLLPADVLTSELVVTNVTDEPRTVHLVLWSMQASDAETGQRFVDDLAVAEETLRFRLHLQHHDQAVQTVGCAFGVDRPVTSYGVQRSQGQLLPPRWAYTPFWDTFDGTGLGDAIHTDGLLPDGVVYLALHTRLDLPPRTPEAVTFGFAAASSPEAAAANLRTSFHGPEPAAASTHAWQTYFEDLPSFTCSDAFLERYFTYRWYGLRLHTLRGGEGHYAHPAVCEGPGYFRAPIAYSAPCHMRETRWMATPALAQGSLLNFIHTQQPDGRFIGYLHPNGPAPDFFYHAPWSFLRDVHHVHPDAAFLEQAYDGLARYARYFDADRDPEGSGLYDVQNHYETGQEYMHRYVAVDEHADRDNWGRVFRLKGVDVAVYLYELKQCLAWMAVQLGRPADAADWATAARKTGTAILRLMWDPEAKLFFDLNPHTGERTGVKAATCFYPYLTDLVDERHRAGLEHLLHPGTFWTPFPAPSSSADDPYFDPDARWKGQRMNCPWNGRVWPMTNSHLAEVLARSALRYAAADLRVRAADFITRFIHMLFFDGDPTRPNSFEHYHPFTGKPSAYRGVDDYQHSWVVDLIVQYVAGVRPAEDHVVVDPFPFEAERFVLDRLPVRGHRLRVERKGTAFTVAVDGDPAGEGRLGTPLRLAI